MQSNSPQFRVGDQIIVVGVPHDGTFGTVIELLSDLNGPRYRVKFENGTETHLSDEQLRAADQEIG